MQLRDFPRTPTICCISRHIATSLLMGAIKGLGKAKRHF